jgi:hypothetical protein
MFLPQCQRPRFAPIQNQMQKQSINGNKKSILYILNKLKQKLLRL